MVTLLLADERINPNHPTNEGRTALMDAACFNHSFVTKALLADGRLDPNIATHLGMTALMFAVANGSKQSSQLLLADARTMRDPPAEDFVVPEARRNFDAALRAVILRARFRGIVRAVIVLRRMRLRAALTVYALFSTWARFIFRSWECTCLRL